MKASDAWFIFFVSIFIPTLVYAQTQENTKLTGVVIDSLSAKPISDVTVTVLHNGSLTDARGQFSIIVKPGDSIFFSHISYRTTVLVFWPSIHQNNVVVRLGEEVKILKEVKISSSLSQEELRQKVLETTPTLSLEQSIANEKAVSMKAFGKYAAPAPATPYDLYLEQLKGPQGVSIFSTDPSKGIITAIKNIVNPQQKIIRSSWVHNSNSVTTNNIFKYIPLKVDTTQIKSDSTTNTDASIKKNKPIDH